METEEQAQEETDSQNEVDQDYNPKDQKKGRAITKGKGKGSKKGKKSNNYISKNFLQLYKKTHLEFLFKELGKKYVLEHFPLIKAIYEKTGVAMVDYQDMYTIDALRKYWKKFFRENTLFRALMCSRVNQLEHKKTFLRLLARFK